MTGLLVALLLSAAPTPGAELALAKALTLESEGSLDASMRALDAAVAACPDWAAARLARARVRRALSAPDSVTDVLPSRVPRTNYRLVAKTLGLVESDLRAALNSEPTPEEEAEARPLLDKATQQRAMVERVVAQEDAEAKVAAEKARKEREARERVEASRTKRAWGVGLVVGAVASGGAAAYFELQARKGFDDIRAGGYATPDDIDAARKDANQQRTFAVGAASAGGALLALGAWMTIANWNDPKPLAVAPAPIPGGAALVVAGTW